MIKIPSANESEGDSEPEAREYCSSKSESMCGQDSKSEAKRAQLLKSELIYAQQSPKFMEVLCKSSGKIRRFSAGTEAGFAVSLINRKLISDCGGGGNVSLATYIEAVKEEEEPISFGPNSLLMDYGSGWTLQTVVESQGNAGARVKALRKETYEDSDDSNYKRMQSQSPIRNSERMQSNSPLSLVYFAKILLVFLLMFLFGAAFTLALEYLPELLLYINSATTQHSPE